MNKAISKFQSVDYSFVARALNYIIFGRHDENLRQTATQEQLKSLEDLEKNLSFLVDMGFINTFDEFKDRVRTIYQIKNNQVLQYAQK